MLDTKIRSLSQKALATALLGPVFLLTLPLVAALNRFVYGIPTFFKQERMGQNDEPFEIVKFQSMKGGAGTDADRITPLGKVLRKTSLDEVPQLVNVWRGNMQLVGWRPLIESYSEIAEKHNDTSLQPEINLIVEIKPGIVGPEQFSDLRHVESLEDMIGFRRVVEANSNYASTRMNGSHFQTMVYEFTMIAKAPISLIKHHGTTVRTVVRNAEDVDQTQVIAPKSAHSV